MRLRRTSPHDPGITRIRRGRGFEYRDANGARVSGEDELARIRALAIPPAWRDVWICARPNGHLQAVGLDDAGRAQYLYHADWSRRTAARKFDRALEFAATLPAVRRGVTRDLRREGLGRERVLAGAFRLLDAELLRVGSERYAQENGSVGLTTLRGEHVAIDGDTVGLSFIGKSGEPWERSFDDPDLAALLAELTARGPSAQVLSWQDDDGWHRLRAAEVNDDLRARAGADATVKDVRTLRGTTVAARALARLGVEPTDAARKRAIAAAAREAAKVLGNTPAVARGSYIDPRVIDRYEHGVVVTDGTLAHVEGQLARLVGTRA
jgi:DNA topoisomerase-1